MSLFLVSTRTSNPPHLPPFVRGALYLSVPWYQYLYTLLRMRPNFKARTSAFIYFLPFIFFFKWILLLLVREKHRKTLYGFLLTKIKDEVKTTRIETLEHDNRQEIMADT